MGDLISDLNLDGRTAPRAQPSDPVFGPAQVPSTVEKKLRRITAWTGFVAAVCSLTGLGILLYMAMQQ